MADIKTITDTAWNVLTIAKGTLEYSYNLYKPRGMDVVEAIGRTVLFGVVFEPTTVKMNPVGLTRKRQNRVGSDYFDLHVKGYEDGTTRADADIQTRLGELARIYRAFNASGGDADYRKIYIDIIDAQINGPIHNRVSIISAECLKAYDQIEGGK